MTRPSIYTALCVHWDHHPVDATQRYGAGVNADEIRRYLQAVKPDVTQYHTIGCVGYVNYPSAIAPVVPGLTGDPLKVWSEVCAEEGIAFGCYAASFACGSPEPHPQWRCVSRAGVVSTQDYCPNSPWTEEFFIPLLLEVMERYHPAHFWLDGVWLPNRDNLCYCAHCRRKFEQEHGRPLPMQPSQRDWLDLQPFYERSLDQAVSRIGRAIRQHDPHILLACNSLYYFKDLRPPAHEVDWLSWDVLNTPNLHRTSFEATYLNTAGKPADVMIYEQGIVRWQPSLLRRPRPLTQLRLEAGAVMAHGCRVNLWHDPQPDGSLLPEKAEVGRAVAGFVRDRQSWCIGNDSLAEVAIVASRHDHALDPRRQDKAVRAMHQILQEAHIPCDVTREDALLTRLAQYQMVILPETGLLEPDTAQWLHQFVTDGGSVLLIAAPPAPEAQPWLDALLGRDATVKPLTQMIPAPEREQVLWCDARRSQAPFEVGHRRVALEGEWQPLAICRSDHRPWAAALTVGEGVVLAIAGEALTDYAETHWPLLRDAVAAVARAGIGDAPLVELTGAPGVEVVVNRRESDVYAHLVNLTPGTCFGAPDEVFFDDAPVYRDLTLTIRPPRLPTHVIAMPGDMPLRFTVNGDAVTVTVPELRDHVGLRLIGAASA